MIELHEDLDMPKLLQLPGCGAWVAPDRVSSVEVDPAVSFNGDFAVVVTMKDARRFVIPATGTADAEATRDQVAVDVNDSLMKEPPAADGGHEMGQHTTPVHYLGAFARKDLPKLIWQFDRQRNSNHSLPIARTLQAPEFYLPDQETELNNRVEQPAQPVINAIRAMQSVRTHDDRRKLSVYMATLIHRVPAKREFCKIGFVDHIIKDAERIKGLLREDALSHGVGELEIQRRCQRVDDIVAKQYSDPDLPPAELWSKMRSPWAPVAMVEAIEAMNWALLLAVGTSRFLTSDNPVHFYADRGVAGEGAEIQFPISPQILLHAVQGPAEPMPTPFREIDDNEVDRRNILTVEHATRFILSDVSLARLVT